MDYNYNQHQGQEGPEEEMQEGSMVENLVVQVVEDYIACKVQLFAKCEEIKKLKEQLGEEASSEDSMDLSTKLQEVLGYKEEVMQTLGQIMASGM